MRTSLRVLLLASIVVPAIAAASPAAAQGIAGTWITRLPSAVRNENGNIVETDSIDITITLEQRGDSVFGTWVRASQSGRPAPTPRKLFGVLKDGELRLSSEPTEARMNRGGEESVISMVSSYTLKLQGDVLSGVQSAASTDGNVSSPERPFSAKRKQG